MNPARIGIDTKASERGNSDIAKCILAAQAADVLVIVYHGGSQPGTKREIGPVRCTDRELVAWDVARSQTKTFDLAKVEVVTADHPAPWYEVPLSGRPKDS
ncbi:MAG: hypothetical protein NTW19_01325 [Planctomycetota bacterium]|nr:hypothetical protein [Planctomycetota bacterium]